MKINCEQKVLVKALNIVSKGVSSRTTIPVLKGIMIEASDDGTVVLSASDQSISIRDTIKSDVESAGSIVVPARLFGDIVRKLPGELVTIECDEENNVSVTSMSSRFRIVGISTDEFPIVNNITDETHSIRFNKETLRTMIDGTSFCASIDESRGVISGVLLEIADGELTMAAIDGYRMAINRETMVTEDTHSFIIPAKILNELSKILAEDESEETEGTLYLSDKKAVFVFDDIQAELSLLAGKFIDYKGIIPKADKITVELMRSQLKEAIDRASILSSADRNNLVRFSITDRILEITSTSEEGFVKEDVPVEKTGDDIVIGFNAKYIRDVLNVMTEEKIKLLFNSAVEPCLFLPEEGDRCEYMVLPVRIN